MERLDGPAESFHSPFSFRRVGFRPLPRAKEVNPSEAKLQVVFEAGGLHAAKEAPLPPPSHAYLD